MKDDRRSGDRRISTVLLFVVIASMAAAQVRQDSCMDLPQADYYASAYKLSGTALRTALHNIIKGHTSVSYASLWTHFQTTDKKANGKVWDMYSDIPNGTPPYEYAFVTNQCGNYGGEGDCYNREHSWPQSWFNSATTPSSDIHHLFPTDGYVNGRRSNYNFGTVSTPTWTSQNGSKVGPCTAAGYTGTVFEPVNAYKGDFARGQFYMSVRYYTQDASWSSSGGTNKSDLLTWYANVLYAWHLADTVSTKEINRNNAIYGIQNNRNPFIDHPEFAAEIWQTAMKPAIVSTTSSGLTATIIDFSRYLDSASAVTASNFTISSGIGSPSLIVWGVNNDVSKIQLSHSALAPGTTYTIQLRNLKSINNVAMNDTTVSFTTPGSPSFSLTLTAFIEGFWNGTSAVRDTISAELHAATSPYGFVTSAKGYSSTAGASGLTFGGIQNGTPYYLVLKHRNAMETWSALPITFASNQATYNFTTAAAQAYGNNVALKSGKYCLYSGDANQDGFIDFSDLSAVDNAQLGFVSGYVSTDLTGDDFVDYTDLMICDNNQYLFIGVMKP